MRRFVSGVFDTPKLSVEEDATDGKMVKEIEYMFYARVESVEALLKAASIEIQEQWGLWHDRTEQNAASGSVRIRKIMPVCFRVEEGKPVALDNVRSPTQYVLTTKIKTASGDNLEVPSEASEDGLTAFKLLAESGMIKHRYIFPIDGTEMKWEVDMFVKPGEHKNTPSYLPYCKIDLEVKDKSIPIPECPAGFTDMFDVKADNLTDEQKQIMKDMQQYLSLPNPYIKKVYEGVV